MDRKGPFTKDRDEPSEYMKAVQIVRRLEKQYEHLSMEERHGCVVEDIRQMDVPEEMRQRLLREFG